MAVTDNFNRADGGLGANWTTVAAQVAPQIRSNVVETNAVGTDSAAVYSGTSFANDQYAKVAAVTLNTATSRTVAAMVRATSGAVGDGYQGLARGPFGGSVTLEIRSGYSTVIAGPTTFTMAANDVLKITAAGTTIKIFINDVQKLSATDSSYASGSAGVYVFVDTGVTGDAQLDNFEGGDGDGSGLTAAQQAGIFDAERGGQMVGTMIH